MSIFAWKDTSRILQHGGRKTLEEHQVRAIRRHNPRTSQRHQEALRTQVDTGGTAQVWQTRRLPQRVAFALLSAFCLEQSPPFVYSIGYARTYMVGVVVRVQNRKGVQVEEYDWCVEVDALLQK